MMRAIRLILRNTKRKLKKVKRNESCPLIVLMKMKKLIQIRILMKLAKFKVLIYITFIYRLKLLLYVSRLNRHFTCQNLAEVDFECHQLIGKAGVYVNEQGIIYSAMLNQVPLPTLNKFKVMFLLNF